VPSVNQSSWLRGWLVLLLVALECGGGCCSSAHQRTWFAAWRYKPIPLYTS